MGRAPCCDKANVKKGPWSPEEDAKLKAYIEEHGTGGNWIALPQKIGLKRCGKSCRLRWLNYLRPNIKHGGFSEEEENLICSLYISIGSRWSIIAAQLPGRTDNDIKNYWNTRLKKKLLGKQRKDPNARRGSHSLKREIKREISSLSDNSHTSSLMDYSFISCSSNNNSNQILPYWPQLPTPTKALQAPVSGHEAATTTLNDHTSIRKLLIKLGGRFSSENLQQIEGSSSSTSSQNPHDHYPLQTSQFAHTQHNLDVEGLQVPQGQASNYTSATGDFIPNDGCTPRLEGLEFLLGEEMNINCGYGFSGWDDLSTCSSMAYPSLISSTPSCEGAQQGLLQEYSTPINELSYPGGHRS